MNLTPIRVAVAINVFSFGVLVGWLIGPISDLWALTLTVVFLAVAVLYGWFHTDKP